jgi:hypothetical protein
LNKENDTYNINLQNNTNNDYNKDLLLMQSDNQTPFEVIMGLLDNKNKDNNDKNLVENDKFIQNELNKQNNNESVNKNEIINSNITKPPGYNNIQQSNTKLPKT